MSIVLELPDNPQETSVEVMSKDAVVNEVNQTMQELKNLPPDLQRQVDDFAKTIDLHNSTTVLQYGQKAQQKLGNFTTTVLDGVRGRDVQVIGKLFLQMSTGINDFNREADKCSKVGKFIKAADKRAKQLQVKYSEVNTTISRIAKDLEGQKAILLVDIDMLDKMYNDNLEYYQELTMYILAGKQRLEEVRSGELEELRQTAVATGDQKDTMVYNDLANHCNDFEKQIYDLELTRTICLQTAPQIRLIQAADNDLVRQVQSNINNTLPLWQQKVSLALAVGHTAQIAKAQGMMRDLTSQMLVEVGKQLDVAVTTAAEESERGIIDLEAVLEHNAIVIGSLDKTTKIHEDGRKTRREAEVEIAKANDAMRQKLLEISQRISYAT